MREDAVERASDPLWSIQLLRGLAAVMVLIGHTQSAVGQIAVNHGRSFARLTILPWGAGVDLFFVISGFIMVYASQSLFGRTGARRAFFLRRIARVAPLYWLCTAVYILILLLASLKSMTALPVSLKDVAASYMFFPVSNGTTTPVPVLGVGWTLNYEMAFYLLFALFIGFGFRTAIVGVLISLSIIVLVGVALPLAEAPIRFWSQPIILNFALGVLLGALCQARVILSAPFRLALIASGALLFCADPYAVFAVSLGGTVPNGMARVFAGGAPAALVMAGLLMGRQAKLPLWLKPAVVLGNASYALYLSHPFALVLMEKLMQKSALARSVPLGITSAATVAGAIAIALLIFRYVERPLTRIAANLLRIKRSVPRLGALHEPKMQPGGSAA